MGRQRVVWSPEEQRFVPEGDASSKGSAPRAPVTDPPDAPAPQNSPPPEGTSVQPRPKQRPAQPRQRESVTITPEQSGSPDNSGSLDPSGSRGTSESHESEHARGKKGSQPSGKMVAAKRSGRRWPRRLLIVVLAFVALLGAGLLFAKIQFDKIEKVPVADVLSPAGGGGTNFLIVGSDSRAGIEEGDPNSGAFLAGEAAGERTDTILLLRLSDDGDKLTSIPRDLWVQNAATGEFGRINSTYQAGPDVLIQTVQQSLGVPVHHYLEIDFVSFGSLVDAVGGITIDFPNPARDDRSGLDVPTAGAVNLDGTQALAYVRSRAYTEIIDGVPQTDPTGDIGRTERQRAFLTSLMGSVGSTRNPFALRSVTDAVAGGLKIDDAMGFFEALRLGWDLKGMSPEAVEIPVFGRTTSGGAAVLELDQPAASEVLRTLGAQ